MPPVDSCASCAGRKAAQNAYQLAAARAEASELDTTAELNSASDGTASGGTASAVTDGAAGKEAAGVASTKAVAPPLLSPDLALQASQASVATDPANAGDNPALRLQAMKAYG
ncbi:MAG: hypothetical protein ACR2Q4_21040 [Geminicoccaceae bacterium]